jgi:hypothetical protein
MDWLPTRLGCTRSVLGVKGGQVGVKGSWRIMSAWCLREESISCLVRLRIAPILIAIQYFCRNLHWRQTGCHWTMMMQLGWLRCWMQTTMALSALKNFAALLFSYQNPKYNNPYLSPTQGAIGTHRCIYICMCIYIYKKNMYKQHA